MYGALRMAWRRSCSVLPVTHVFERSTRLWCAGLILVLAVLAILAYKLDIGNYRHLKDTARLTFLKHVIFFLVFLTTSIPYSVAVLRSFFAPLGPAYLLQLPTFRCISFPLGFQLVLYAYEVAIGSTLHSIACI